MLTYTHLGHTFPTRETFEIIDDLNKRPPFFSTICPHRCLYLNNDMYPNKWIGFLNNEGKNVYSCQIAGKILHIRNSLAPLRKYIMLAPAAQQSDRKTIKIIETIKRIEAKRHKLNDNSKRS
jgi:hypothetical protein